MNKVLIIMLLTAFNLSTYAQNDTEQPIEYADVLLATEADYEKAEPMVLDAAKYLLSIPADNTNLRRVDALQLILTWMEGTPYIFEFESFDKIGEDINAKAAYIAALTKTYLENKTKSEEDPAFIKINSWKTFLTYCENSSNNLRLNSELEQLIEANKNGELERML